MQVFSQARRIIVTCNKWLAPYLEQEVTGLGFKIARTFPTGLELRGTVADCIRLNLNLRCASQVLYSLKDFHCDDPDSLYDSLSTIPWESILPEDGYFSVTGNVFHPTIRSTMYANVRVKDAIVDRLRDKSGSRPDSGAELLGAVVHLYWKNDLAEIFIDTNGESLVKHGYRKIPGAAPMLESLAAATILATKWDQQSPFVNPMCGAGTLVIEAALIATNRRPGLFRTNYSFMHLVDYDPQNYERERKKLDAIIVTPKNAEFIASDIDPQAVEFSKINAAAAGVVDLIQFSICDFEATTIPENGNGVVMFNPEYGERLGEESELATTYSRIGDFMKKKCGGYVGYVFTGNLDLAKKIGLKAKRRIEFVSAKLDCRLLEFELYQGTRRVRTEIAESSSEPSE